MICYFHGLMFYRVYFQENEGKFEVDRYGENKATYLGMGIGKVSDSDYDGIMLDSDNYEGAINHIEIPRDRTRHRNKSLTEEEHAIFAI